MYHIHFNFMPVNYGKELEILQNFSSCNIVDSIRYEHYGLALTIIADTFDELMSVLNLADWAKVHCFSFYQHD